MKTYLVALKTGGEMGGNPTIYYEEHEIIEAETSNEAETIYNKKHNCSYYYAYCMGEIIDGKVTLDVETFFMKRY